MTLAKREKKSDNRPSWKQDINPSLPVIIVIRPREDAMHEVFERCVQALATRYNILLCGRRTPWWRIWAALRAAKMSRHDVHALLLSRLPATALLRSCRRCKIPTVFLAEMDNVFVITSKMVRFLDKIVYTRKSVFEMVSDQVFWGKPVGLTILSQLDDWGILTDEMVNVVAVVRLELEQRQRDIKFLRTEKPIDLAYWSGRRTKLWLSRKDALRYLREWQTGLSPKRPIAGFHPGIYADHHDLTLPNGVCADPFIHYLQSGCPKGKWVWPVLSENIPLSEAARQSRVALHIHAFYVDMLPDIMIRLQANTIRPDLFISVTDEASYAQVQSCLVNYEARWTSRVVPNRGRDIGALLTEFGQDLVENYDIIGHVHTKKSLYAHHSHGERWRNFLFYNLLGDGKTERAADVIVQKMSEDTRINFVFPDDKNAVSWGVNYESAKKLASNLGMTYLPKNFVFPVGTMFWISSSLLRRFVDMKLEWKDYMSEPLPVDGTDLHALERLFGAVTQTISVTFASTLFGRIRR